VADANFMTSVGETRLLPEDLATTYEKLSRAWHAIPWKGRGAHAVSTMASFQRVASNVIW
jgi:hypothetical protein